MWSFVWCEWIGVTRLMILKKYKLREFSLKFEKELREPIGEKFSNEDAFKELKEELLTYLKTFDESLDLHLFDDLNIYLEGFSLCFSYKETTGQKMTIRLIRRVNDLTPKIIKDYINTFIEDKLGGDDFPYVTFPRTFSYQHLAIYWPEDRLIAISNHMYQQLPQEEVESVLRHEAIHHYLNVSGLPAGDMDDEFIELLLEHNGYISKELGVQAAISAFVEKKERKEKIAKQKATREARKLKNDKEK